MARFWEYSHLGLVVFYGLFCPSSTIPPSPAEDALQDSRSDRCRLYSSADDNRVRQLREKCNEGIKFIPVQLSETHASLRAGSFNRTSVFRECFSAEKEFLCRLSFSDRRYSQRTCTAIQGRRA